MMWSTSTDLDHDDMPTGVSAGTKDQEIKPPSKRRKTRKGTHSCWECKRRKERCVFVSENATCSGCLKRRTPCISQEFPSEISPRTASSSSDISIRRVEELLQQLLDRTKPERSDTHGTLSENGASQLQNKLLPENQQAETNIQNGQPKSRDKYPQTSSEILLAALPPRCDVDIICRAIKRHQMRDIMVNAYDGLDTNADQLLRDLSDYPSLKSSPAAVARYLLRLATHLQRYFDTDTPEETKELTQPVNNLIARCIDAAAPFIGQDQLQGDPESLDCMLLLAVYECSQGNLRLSWMLVRRAITVAQLNRMHLPDNLRRHAGPESRPQISFQRLWVRLNYYDRLGSLLLDLPMAVESDNTNMIDAAVDGTLLANIERMHCAIMGDIIKRNQYHRRSNNLQMTRALDLQLQKITAILPASWWTMPLPILESSSRNSSRDFSRILTIQMLHSALILLVHLPYLLSSSPDSDYALSRAACVDSAREILTRYLLCRSLKYGDMICRISDLIAFIAAVTLSLAYLTRYHQRAVAASTWPAHRRQGDLGMIQDLQRIMRDETLIGFDSQCARMGDILCQLLSMESKAVAGHRIWIKHVTYAEDDAQDQMMDAVRLQVPYFGTILIQSSLSHIPDANFKLPDLASRQNDGEHEQGSDIDLPATSETAPVMMTKALSAPSPVDLEPPSQISQSLVHEQEFSSFELFPSMFARADDWSLQGIDTALFSTVFGQSTEDWTIST